MFNQSFAGVTVQLKVTNFEEGRLFYKRLLRREPDMMFLDNFAEWEVIPNLWLQVAEGEPAIGAGAFRFGVANIEAERNRIMHDLGIEVSEVAGLDGVPARWCNFDDPSGNCLGLYQEIPITNTYDSRK